MAFSLSNWFKGKSNGTTNAPAEGSNATSAPVVTPVLKSVAPSKPSAPPVTQTVPSVRKVVPNSVQPVNLRDPSARPPVSLGVSAPAGPGAARPVTSLVPPRKISFGNPAATAAAHPPTPEPVAPPSAPEPAFVLDSVPDVPVSLEVGDFIDRVPPTLLAGGAVDRNRRVEFRSSELYSDLTKGRASVPASVIYEKCPELFARPVSETEDAEVALPLAKLVEQLTPALQTRADQVAEENVGEIETPFLQVALEDSTRLPTAAGTTAGAIRPPTPLPAAPTAASVQVSPVRPPHRTGQIQTISAPKVPLNEPVSMPAAPTAQSAGPINPSKRPPSTVRASVAGGKIRLSGPTVPSRISLTPGQPVPPPPAMPFGVPPVANNDLPPSATQRIATSMPPLPTSVTSPSHQVTKKTQRIQIPPISLRSPTNPSATPPARPPAVPVQPSPVTVRPNNGDAEPAAPVMFRSSPPPPPAAKPMPHTFAPAPMRPAFPPPAFPAMPPLDAAPVPAPVADDRKIILGLSAILRGMSASLLAVEPSSVSDDVKVSLPFALVEPQMRTGRVSVPRAVFIEALPEGHKEVLDADVDLPEIPLPLQEVFQNLPSNALTMRADQTEEQIAHLYPTPFSQKAEEDAQRLGVGEVPTNVAPVAEAPVAPAVEPEAAAPASPTDHPLPAEEPPAAEVSAPVITKEESAEPVRDILLDLEEKTPEPVEDKAGTPAAEPAEEAPAESAAFAEPETKDEVTPALVPVIAAPEVMPPEPASATQKLPVPAKGKDSELQVLFMTEEELDAKTIVRFVSQMPGINGCAVMFGDGLRLAGNFPEESQVEGFSAMAPPFFKRAKNFASESGLGTLQAFTLHTDRGPCSFLMHDDICVGVRHSNRGFMPGVREKLEIVVRELARMYSTAS